MALGVLFVMIFAYGIGVSFNLVWVPALTCLALITAIAVSLWLSALNARYRDAQYMIPFLVQILLSLRALQWRGTSFNEGPDRWLSNLAQAAEWFPMLGLIGTVAGIMQTFSSISGSMTPQEIISKYAPAITATGSGLFMALFNILPAWVVLLGRDLILALGGEADSEKHVP